MEIYWDSITERLRLIKSKGGSNALKPYGGPKILHAVDNVKKKQIIHEHIVKQEWLYVDDLLEYKK